MVGFDTYQSCLLLLAGQQPPTPKRVPTRYPSSFHITCTHKNQLSNNFNIDNEKIHNSAVFALCSSSLMAKSHELTRMMESSNIVPRFRMSTITKHLRIIERKTDIDILSPIPHSAPAPWEQIDSSSPLEHSGRSLALDTCLSTCKDEALCRCLSFSYGNSTNSTDDDGSWNPEYCIAKISSSCKANNLLSFLFQPQVCRLHQGVRKLCHVPIL